MIRVLVADDHDSVRRLLVHLIESGEGMEVAGEARDGIEALALFESTAVDVLLLDLTMPNKGGIETLRELLPRHPDARVLVVSMHPPEQLAARMIRAGARGYLGKDRLADCLHHAIRAVHAGDVYVDAAETKALSPVTRAADAAPAQRSL